jgi:hypothetical protein
MQDEIELVRTRYGELRLAPDLNWLIIEHWPLPAGWNRPGRSPPGEREAGADPGPRLFGGGGSAACRQHRAVLETSSRGSRSGGGRKPRTHPARGRRGR